MTGFTASNGYLTGFTGLKGYIDTFTASNGYISSISGSTGYIRYITGSNIHLNTFTGSTGYIRYITGSNIYLNTFTGSTGYIRYITGSNIHLNTFTATNGYLTGFTSSNGYIDTFTGINGCLTYFEAIRGSIETQPDNSNNKYIANTEYVHNNTLSTTYNQTATSTINLTNVGFDSTPSSITQIITTPALSSTFISNGLVCNGNGSLVYIWGVDGTTNYIYVYNNSYSKFLQLYTNSGTGTKIISVSIDYTGRYVYVSLAGSNQPLYSNNYGCTFTSASTPITSTYNYNNIISCSNNGSAVAFGVNTMIGKSSIFTNTNSGIGSWTSPNSASMALLSSNTIVNQILGIAILTTGSNYIILAVSINNIYKSIDNGISYSSVYDGNSLNIGFSGLITYGIQTNAYGNYTVYIGTTNIFRLTKASIFVTHDNGSSFYYLDYSFSDPLETVGLSFPGLSCSEDGNTIYCSSLSGVVSLKIKRFTGFWGDYLSIDKKNVITTNLYGRICLSKTGDVLYLLQRGTTESGQLNDWGIPDGIGPNLYICSTNQNFTLYNDVNLPKNRLTLFTNPSYSHTYNTTNIYYPYQVQLIPINTSGTSLTLQIPFYETYVLNYSPSITTSTITLPLISEQTVGLSIKFIIQTANSTSASVTWSAQSTNGIYGNSGSSAYSPTGSISNITRTPISFIAIPGMYTTSYPFIWEQL